MSNQIHKEKVANWLWSKDKINDNNGVKAQSFFNEAFACFAVFFGFMWLTGSYKFQVTIGDDVTFVGSLILYALVVYLVSCFFSWFMSLIFDIIYGKEIANLSGKYPRKPKYTCY